MIGSLGSNKEVLFIKTEIQYMVTVTLRNGCTGKTAYLGILCQKGTRAKKSYKQDIINRLYSVAHKQ